MKNKYIFNYEEFLMNEALISKTTYNNELEKTISSDIKIIDSVDVILTFLPNGTLSKFKLNNIEKPITKAKPEFDALFFPNITANLNTYFTTNKNLISEYNKVLTDRKLITSASYNNMFFVKQSIDNGFILYALYFTVSNGYSKEDTKNSIMKQTNTLKLSNLIEGTPLQGSDDIFQTLKTFVKMPTSGPNVYTKIIANFINISILNKPITSLEVHNDFDKNSTLLKDTAKNEIKTFIDSIKDKNKTINVTLSNSNDGDLNLNKTLLVNRAKSVNDYIKSLSNLKINYKLGNSPSFVAIDFTNYTLPDNVLPYDDKNPSKRILLLA